MINATNLIPLSKPKHVRIKDSILIPALVVCGISILIGFVLFGKCLWKKGRCRTSNHRAYYPV